MNHLCKTLSLILLACLIIQEPAIAQKEKEKEKEKENVVKKGKTVFNKIKSFKTKFNSSSSSPATAPAEPSTETYADNRETKKRKLTPPDVRLQINNANQAYTGDDFVEARFYIQQAIMGIELEMGYEILRSMPDKVLGIAADLDQDEVYSTGAGFAGMIVGREYPDAAGNIKATVGNNATIYSSVGLQAGYDAQVYGGDPTTKVIRYQNNKAYVKVDDYAGYELLVPFGQSSVFLIECPVCETEAQLMEVADRFDIEKYKEFLGEQ